MGYICAQLAAVEMPEHKAGREAVRWLINTAGAEVPSLVLWRAPNIAIILGSSAQPHEPPDTI